MSGKTLQWTPAGCGRLPRPGTASKASARQHPRERHLLHAAEAQRRPHGQLPRPRRRRDGEWSNAVTIAFPARGKATGRRTADEEPPNEEPPKERPKKEHPPEEEPPRRRTSGEEPPFEERTSGTAARRTAVLRRPERGLLGIERTAASCRRVGTVVRLDTPPKLTPWEAVGLKVIADISGPYSQRRRQRPRPPSLRAEGRRLRARKTRTSTRSRCSTSPAATGSGARSAESRANRESYAQLLIEVHEALVAELRRAPAARARLMGRRPRLLERVGRSLVAQRDRAGRRRRRHEPPLRRDAAAARTAILGNRRLVEAAHEAARTSRSTSPRSASRRKARPATRCSTPKSNRRGRSSSSRTWARQHRLRRRRHVLRLPRRHGRRRLRRRDARRREEARLHRAAGAARKPALHDLPVSGAPRRRARAGGSCRSAHRGARGLGKACMRALVLGRRELRRARSDREHPAIRGRGAPARVTSCASSMSVRPTRADLTSASPPRRRTPGRPFATGWAGYVI